MKTTLKRFFALAIPPTGAPLVLLAAAVLAYGLLLPQMGFYWDDLPMSWIRYQLGPEAMTRYFSTNRPVWGLLYQITTRLLPHVPIYWQVFALFWRWLGALLFWAIVRRLWPRRDDFALAAGLLFLLYPGFNQQWGSYLYSHFFIVLAFFLLSFLCMFWAWERRPRLFTALGMFFSALNLWMLEYFFVLELARPAVIWIALRDETPDRSDGPQDRRSRRSPRQRLRLSLGLWTPYLAVFAAAILSRLFIFNNQIYGFGLSDRLTAAPLETLLTLLTTIPASLWTVSGAAWAQVFYFPSPALEGPRTTALYGAVTLVTFVMAAYALGRPQPAQVGEGSAASGEARSAIGLGVLLLLLAGWPFWLTGVPVSLGFPANRATLAFMPGVSLLLAALIRARRWRVLLLAALVGLAAGRHSLWADDFRRDWNSHRALFWQMTWRAPGLQPGTVVLMNEELSFYADNSLGAALNWVYAPDNRSGRIDYVLFYPTNRLGGALPALQPGLPLRYDFLAGQFEGDTSQVAAFYYAPPGCLRLLDAEIDPYNRLIPDDSLMRAAATLSRAAPILSQPTARMPAIYGSEPTHGWCYYFEKADLARQQGDWERVAALGEVAFALDDYPNDPVERFVFIEGYAHVGNWERAEGLSLEAHKVSPKYLGPLLCRLWERIEATTPANAQQRAAVAEMSGQLNCHP